MKKRCYSPKDLAYKNYGGRGITICDEWRASPACFIEWAIQNGWRRGLEIDRRDNNGPYSPLNCRFVTRATNSRNTRRNVHLTAFGETKVLEDWVADERCTVASSVLRTRIDRGWEHERAIATPSSGSRKTYSAFGESKTLAQWTRDPRCAVQLFTLFTRIRKKNWPIESAIITPVVTKEQHCRPPEARGNPD
jgi:hypothetical protein